MSSESSLCVNCRQGNLSPLTNTRICGWCYAPNELVAFREVTGEGRHFLYQTASAAASPPN
eukprot:5434844-Prorocentrum_lima.AAC.1